MEQLWKIGQNFSILRVQLDAHEVHIVVDKQTVLLSGCPVAAKVVVVCCPKIMDAGPNWTAQILTQQSELHVQVVLVIHIWALNDCLAQVDRLIVRQNVLLTELDINVAEVLGGWPGALVIPALLIIAVAAGFACSLFDGQSGIFALKNAL